MPTHCLMIFSIFKDKLVNNTPLKANSEIFTRDLSELQSSTLRPKFCSDFKEFNKRVRRFLSVNIPLWVVLVLNILSPFFFSSTANLFNAANIRGFTKKRIRFIRKHGGFFIKLRGFYKKLFRS